ncbi:Carbohydrate sulfotransferase 8 [Fukomys damarensis]|uniref:Carbohydrate sulfotransferase n=1 Tax=Fukomys damarensis TaxID=885580 RepID=A0A091E4J8_FUKDA|nr:Carbohydrate sulfotransferase 8 [Fukomys damarensis]
MILSVSGEGDIGLLNSTGIKFNIRPQQPHKDLQPDGSQDGVVKVPTDRVTRDLSSRAPRDLKLHVPDQPRFHPKTGTRLRLRQRRRRLLIKKMPSAVAVVANGSSETFVPPPQTQDSHWDSLQQSQQERKRVPKAGCSNWKRVLMVLAGLASSTADIQHNTVHYGSALKRLDTFDRQGILHRLGTYTKMLFVREPFERLVSAFRDKFEHPNSYYHPVFGKAILARYRANASREALRTGSGVRFPEFVQYLLDYLLDVHRPVGMDIHWDHVSRLCSPCLIDYDFVGKFESVEDDANFFLSLIRAPRNLTFPRFKDRHSQEARTTSRITHQYFAQLSALQRQRTYDFYYMDYLMFNYSKPFADLY